MTTMMMILLQYYQRLVLTKDNKTHVRLLINKISKFYLQYLQQHQQHVLVEQALERPRVLHRIVEYKLAD